MNKNMNEHTKIKWINYQASLEFMMLPKSKIESCLINYFYKTSPQIYCIYTEHFKEHITQVYVLYIL